MSERAITKGWMRKTLGDLIEVLTDYTANGSFESLRQNVKYYSEPNYSALVRTTDLEKKDFSPQRFTDKRGHEFQKKTALYGGEIVLANVGSVGKVYRVPQYDGPMTLAPNTYLVKFRKDCSEEFIFQFLKSEFYISALFKNISSTTLAAINKDNFRSIEIDLPIDVGEQERIAEILSVVDNQIDATQALIDKYTAIKQGMMADLFSRGIDPETKALRPTFEEAPELYHKTPLGMLPKGWEISLLEEIAPIIDPQPDHRTPPQVKDGVPYVGVGDFTWDERIDAKKCRKVSPNAYLKQQGRFKVEIGDVIFGKIGTIGQPKVIRENGDFALSANVLLIKSGMKGNYIRDVLVSQYTLAQLDKIVNVTSQPAVGIQTMRELMIPTPGAIELELINSKLQGLESYVWSEVSSLNKLKAQKFGLMQDLLTGKVSVPA